MIIGYFLRPDTRLASYRYRVMIPARELRKMGFAIEHGPGHVTVFSKHWGGEELEAARKLVGAGRRVVFDICDDHFADEHRDYYMRMCEVATRITCATPYLAERIRAETGREATPITDPYEYPKAAPRLRSGRAKNVLWFGHSSNHASWEALRGLTGERTLMVCSDVKPDFPCLFSLWNREMMPAMFHWSDVVIIPAADWERARSKSPNRLVESIRQGRFVVANQIPSYEGYGQFLGDLNDGLAWVDENPETAIVRVRDAQNKVEAFHSPREVASLWRRVFIEHHDTRGTEVCSRQLAAAD